MRGAEVMGITEKWEATGAESQDNGYMSQGYSG